MIPNDPREHKLDEFFLHINMYMYIIYVSRVLFPIFPPISKYRATIDCRILLQHAQCGPSRKECVRDIFFFS